MLRRELGKPTKTQRSNEWTELVGLTAFTALTVTSLALPLTSPLLGSARYAPAFNAALSIGTGGLVSYAFYFLVNQRLERRRRALMRGSFLGTYRNAKYNIAFSILSASQKGGRKDIQTRTSTIDKALTIRGFREMFEGGTESDTGFYAFQNQMSDKTYEYDEILLNLRNIARAADRLIESGTVSDQSCYDFFVWLDALVERITRNGPGYDESKPLCALLWEVFAGYNNREGDVGYDPIERAIEQI